MYQKYFSRFINANTDVLHFACHSHHYWPDVTYDATIEYWNDSARLVDNKWNHILGFKVPETQKLIAGVLKTDRPENICFAPNTHDLLIRLMSCLEVSNRPDKKIKILTTDSEFYSFTRQAQRYVELGYAEITQISTQPFKNFNERFTDAIKSDDYDLIFFSQVFFNSGIIVDHIIDIVDAAKPETMIVIDGYHGFMAVPTDLSKIQDRIFYISGSYKYAQGGEGCCFMTVPENCKYTPAITGWFAGFSDLDNTDIKKNITYSKDGYRFAGSTMDFTALYRLNAVLNLYSTENITVEKTHRYVQNVQNNFLTYLDLINHPYLNRKYLVLNDITNHGHFFAFNMPTIEICNSVKKDLSDLKVITDSRGKILRFGFSIYQNTEIDLRF